MYRLLLGLAAAALVLIGCNASPPAPKAAESQSAQVTSSQDKAESQHVIEAYFTAVINNDAATIDLLWRHDERSPRGAMAPLTGKRPANLQMTLDHIGMENGTLTAFYTVTVDLGPNPGGAWSPGINTRWAVLQKVNGTWQINAMATSPHAYAK